MTTVAATPLAAGNTATDPWQRLLLGLAALRGALGLVAIPLAPFLFREHAAVLVLLRPTKEVFLLVGFLVDEQRVSLAVVVLAALPLLLGGVWVFYGLGRIYQAEIRKASLPGLAGRLVPAKRVRRLIDAVEAGGPKLVLLGRFASFPSSLVAAAAGAGGLRSRPFVLADTGGALGSMALTLGAGYVLEDAYEKAGPWLTGLGVLTLVAMATVLGHHLRAPRPSRPR